MSLRPLGAAGVHPSRVTKPKRDIARPLSRSTPYHLLPIFSPDPFLGNKNKNKNKENKEASYSSMADLGKV